MSAFEYKTIEFDASRRSLETGFAMEKELNRFGKEGWELVSVYSNSQLGSTKYSMVGLSLVTVAVLKRKQIMSEKEIN